MKTVPLGIDGTRLSRLGLGAMSFAGIYGSVSEAVSHRVLDEAHRAGITHIDTAVAYGAGRSEEIVGSWLAARPGVRTDMTIATKAGFRKDAATGATKISNDPEYMETALDGALKRLGVDSVDIFYAHRLEPGRAIEDVAGEMGRLVEKGKARTIGFSEIAPNSLRLANETFPVGAVQSEYSLWTRSPEMGLLDAAAETKTAMVAFSPLGRTMLTDRPWGRERIESMDFIRTNPRFEEPNYSRNIAASARFREFAAARGEPSAALAIAWVLSRGDHVVPIPGTSSLSHLQELIRGATLNLSETDCKEIERILPIGWAFGDRYSLDQWVGPEKYC